MSIEHIQNLRSHASTIRGCYLSGKGSTISGGGPGGTTILNASVKGWDATMGMNCYHMNLEAFNTSFGSNGGASWAGFANNPHLGAWFPPWGAAPGPNRIMRIRDIVRFRVTQADVNNPLSKAFYGFYQEVNAGSSGTGLVAQRGWCGFVSWWTGTTPGNWYAIVTDYDSPILTLHNVDTGIGTDAPHMMRIDVDPIDQEIRFYIDEVLLSTYVPSPGFQQVLDTSPYPNLGWGLNPGYTSGAVVNTIADIWTEVCCYNGGLTTMETP